MLSVVAVLSNFMEQNSFWEAGVPSDSCETLIIFGSWWLLTIFITVLLLSLP